MGLLIDGQINSTQDLRNYENGILDLASLENLDLTGKMALAQDEAGSDIFKFLLKHTARDPGGFLWWYSGNTTRRTIGVSDVVVTPELKRWHALKTLALVYADAYSNQLNDRYARKRDQYDALGDAAESTYFDVGVGLSFDPVTRAATPILSTVGGTGAGSTYYVQVAWLNRTGQEGSPSEAASIVTGNGTQLTVGIWATPANATGWNVYAGTSPQSAVLQNSAPIAINEIWTLPSSGLVAGNPAGSGQTADRYVVGNQVLLRG